MSDAASVADAVLEWSRAQNYCGYNKHDGLNSALLRTLAGWGRWPRLFAIQVVMRSPINLRGVLGIEKTCNPKGLALFSQGLMDRYRATGDAAYLSEAEVLLERLVGIRPPGNWSGRCWGYPYPWQDAAFFADSGTPNAVVTCFVCEAFLDAYRLTGKHQWLDVVGETMGFFGHDLTVLKDSETELCLAYMPLPMRMRVMDVSILIGAVIAKYAACAEDARLASMAERLVRYVVRRQTDYHAWFYTDPAGDSHVKHDNYHTGFILDALWRYMQVSGDWHWQKRYRSGLAFYAEHFFEPSGAPRWRHNRSYPRDIHGAAQGILTFSRHQDEYPDLAARICAWSIANLYNTAGYFYYRRNRLYRNKLVLMRWCNAWMARALSHFVYRCGQAG